MTQENNQSNQSIPTDADKKPSRRTLVEQAVLQLMLEGKSPTIAAVRSITKTGSYSTITSDIKEILRSLAVLTSPDTGIPHEVSKAFNAIWLESLAVAKTQHSQELHDAQAEIELLFSSNKSLQDQLQNAEQSLDEAKELIAQKTQFIERLDSQINHMKTTIAQMESTAIGEHRKASLVIEEKSNQVDALETKLKELVISHEKSLSALQSEHKERIANEISRSETTENKWIQQTSNLQVQLAKKTDEIIDCQRVISDLKTQLSSRTQENAQLNQQIASLEKRAAEFESKLQSNDSLQKTIQDQFELMRNIHNKMEAMKALPQNNTGG